jgi:hypothetical protein
MTKLMFGLWIISVSVTACKAEMLSGEVPPGARMFLRGSTGPYRGRVIDAKSKQPIAGTIVVAAWYREIDALVQSNTVFYDAIEVVADGQGNFIVDAPNIERRAPSNTQFPVFTIFKPGYRFFQGYFASIDDLFDLKNKSLLGVVELQPVVHLTKSEQLQAFPSGPPHGVPNVKVPAFLRAWDSERTRLLKLPK